MSSFIDDVKKTEDKQDVFIVNSQEDNTQSLANYLPGGNSFLAKNIENSKTRNTLSSFALELIRKENILKWIADQYYIYTSIDLLDQWEEALGIPDSCFFNDADVSIEQRQKQVVAKLALMSVKTRGDFIALAEFFDVNITITTDFEASTFSLTLPFTLGDESWEKFIIIVRFLDYDAPPGFSYTLPFTLGDGTINAKIKLIECLFKKLTPAYTKVIFRFRDN